MPLLGLHHLDNGKASVLLAYCALTALSLLTDAYTLGALPDWAGTSGAQAFGGSCYLMAALLKPAALVGMALVHRQEDADRRTRGRRALHALPQLQPASPMSHPTRTLTRPPLHHDAVPRFCAAMLSRVRPCPPDDNPVTRRRLESRY